MNTELIEHFREQMRHGPVIGPFMKTCDPAFVEAAGYAGMNFVILDTEHGPISIENMQNNIRAAQLAGVFPIVRVGNLENISKALDIGAAGIQVPQVSSKEEAMEVIREAKFYPGGERGVCRFVRAAHYSTMARERYFAEADKALVILQLEGQEAIDNLDEIMEVEGIDVLFIGPYDLSQSLGVPGQTTHPEVIRQMRSIVKAAKERGLLVGTFTDSAETLKMWSDAGVQYLSYSVDVGIFADACARVKEELRMLQAG